MSQHITRGGKFTFAVIYAFTLTIALTAVYIGRHGDGTVGDTLTKAALAWLGFMIALSGTTIVLMWLATPFVPRHPTWLQRARYALWCWL